MLKSKIVWEFDMTFIRLCVLDGYGVRSYLRGSSFFELFRNKKGFMNI